MNPAFASYPEQHALIAHLTEALVVDGILEGPPVVVDRTQNIYSSTFPSEVVTCRMADGRELKVLCKYADSHNDSHGNRGDIGYEAQVYRNILRPGRVSAPAFYGVQNSRGDEFCLILEFLEGAAHLNKSEDSGAMLKAARWIGKFHASHETQLCESSIAFLKLYDLEYYQGWVQRTLRFAGRLHPDFPWLKPLCRRFGKILPELFSFPVTIIHGEYYPQNILVQEGAIRPVDWQTAALAIGEIDLATLTDRWSEDITRQCVLEYRRARWPEGAPEDCERAWLMASLYLQFRWLGDRREWTRHESNLWRFEALRLSGERLGLIPAG